MDSLIIQHNNSNVELAIAAWLDAKSKRTNSATTHKAYTDVITSFRIAVQSVGLDLDAPTSQLSLIAQIWSSNGNVSLATINKRLAIISSFYKYANDRELLFGNPIKSDMRAKIEPYNKASAVSHVADKLKAIDTFTIEGKRDYALLRLTLMTGRRLAEIAALTINDITLIADEVVIVFRRTKGGKTAKNIFKVKNVQFLLDYIYALYGVDVFSNDYPLWISFARNKSNGKQLSVRSLENICLKHIEVNFHTLRHTFARNMESKGAKVSEIQSHLGHTSLATTGRYLASLNSGHNTVEDELTKLYET